MARCAYCSAETEEYQSGVPICHQCPAERSQEEVKKRLLEELYEATKRADAVSQDFDSVIDDLPTGVLQADNIEQIHNASRQMIAVQNELMAAENRLTDFLSQAATPQDTKPNG